MGVRGAAALVPIVLSLALAACGGDGNEATTTRPVAPTTSGDVQADDVRLQLAFETGSQACAAHPPKTLAGFYGSAPNPEAIARAYGKATGDTPAVREAARRGCLSAFAND